MPSAKIARFDMVGLANRLLAGPIPIPARPTRPAQITQQAYQAACEKVRMSLAKAGYFPDDQVVQDVARKAIAGYLFARLSAPVEG